MKKILFWALLSLGASNKSVSQFCYVGYSYDGSGNRIQRQYYCVSTPEPADRHWMPDTPNTTGVPDLTKVPSANIFPNPTTGKFTLVVPTEMIGAQIELLNAAGQIQLVQKVNETDTDFDLTKMAPGAYFLRIRRSKMYQVFKITKR